MRDAPPFNRAVLITTEAYGGFGGIATYNIDFVDALSQCGFTQIDVVPRLVRSTPGEMPDNVHLHTDASKSILSFAKHAFKQSANPADVVICGHVNLLPFAYPLSRKLGVPLVTLLYGIEAWEPTNRPMVDRLTKKCDYFLSISPFTTDLFQSWSGVASGKIGDLPNAIDISEYGIGDRPTYLAERYGLQNKKVVMTLGRLEGKDRRKGVDELIDITPDLLKKRPDIAVLVCGGGDDKARLEARVTEKELQDHIIFADRIDEAEKADHFRLCDVFTMVGKQEGFGFVFLEALATGAPVVASTKDGSRDAVLNGELGELADPDDLQSIVDAIDRAMDKPRQIPDKLTHYSFDNFTNRLRDSIRSMINGQTI